MSRFTFGSPDFRSGASYTWKEMKLRLKSPTCDSSAKGIPLRPRIHREGQKVLPPQGPGERDLLLKLFSMVKGASFPTALKSRNNHSHLNFRFGLGCGVNDNLPIFA